MNFKLLLPLALILLCAVASSGCISACVPVKVDAKYPNINDGYIGIVIIDGKAIGAYDNAYKKMEANQTYDVQFESSVVTGGSVINTVCSP
jgi:hypothetical protein